MEVVISQQIRRTGVIGAGTMGNGIAQVFAVAGYPVIMRDLNRAALDRGLSTIANSLGRLVAREKVSASDREQALGRIHATTELKDLADCDLVVEAILENFELKAGLVRELDQVCRPDAIFATNTSSVCQRSLRLVERQPELRHYHLRPRQGLLRVSVADEVVGLIDGMSAESLIASAETPVLQEAVHVDYGEHWADGRCRVGRV